ncbi:membrane protein [Streptomyces phage Keanu]|nr:membrane protein [Streptomyces phage Keanu]
MDFSKLPLATGSATALLGLVLLLVLLGKLVPRSTLEDARKDAEQVRAERDRVLEEKQREVELWRSAFMNEVGTTRELSSQNSQLMEVARTADRVLRSLPSGAGDSPNDGSNSSGVVPQP